jgi:F-type H+-transporting ATPase subunit epsilon
MAPTLFHLDVITPAGTVLARDVSYVEAPGEEGRLGVQAGHQSCIIGLAAGRLHLRGASGGLDLWDIGRGVMTVTPAAVTVLVPAAAPSP